MHAAWRPAARGLGLVALLVTVAAAVAATAAGTAWWLSRYVYARPFDPTRLTPTEERQLDQKLARLDRAAAAAPAPRPATQRGALAPAPYTERESDREITLTERELNALIARDTGAARRVAVDLADDLASVIVLLPIDPGVPLLGGKTVRIATGIELGYASGRPVVAIRGISLGGVPLPRAWWGDIKGANLVAEFGTPGGFWDRFARGIDDIRVRDGELRLRLRE